MIDMDDEDSPFIMLYGSSLSLKFMAILEKISSSWMSIYVVFVFLIWVINEYLKLKVFLGNAFGERESLGWD